MCIRDSIKYRKRYDICEVRVVRANKSFGLLGRDMLPSQLDELCNATSQDDEPALGTIRNAKARLTISENAKPIFCNAREVPLLLKQKVEEELQKMIDMGIISPVPAGGSEWASPLVCVRKSDNTLRLCCDYKVTINKYLLNDQYNAPDMETIFSKLEGAKNFAKFDLKSAFWQVELDESSKKLTTINTSKGLFWFNRLPFGVKTASCIFQRIIENICKGLEGILAYQDDILVYAKDASELKIRSEALLKRLNKRNVQINWSKSIRSLESVTFLGHTVSAEGIEPDKKLVNKILNISPPRCRKDVERFLGLANFYHTKISNFAKICEPLNKLRRQGMPFVWRNEQQNAFVNLKEALCSRQVVQPYSLNKELTLECDASETSIGSVLSQEGAPVMFLSRTLTKNERNYAVIEKEALAIVWSVKRAEKFLLGRHFNIKTDHNSLEYIFGEHKCLPKHTSARIQRWAVTMTNYDYTIRYVRGKEIPHVDAMSRLNFTIEDITNINSLDEDIFWNDECGVTWMEIAQETINDRLLRGVKHRIKENLWENCAPAEKQYQKNRAALSIENNVIILGTRPVIPRTLQDKIMKTAHQAHFGMTTTKNVLRQSVWWPGMDRSIEEFIRSCEVCAYKPKTNVESEQYTWETAKIPFERIHLDWAQIPNIGTILIVVDAMSGWPEAFLCKNRSTAVVKKILQSLFARYGVPQKVVTDNAPEFVSNELSQWIINVGGDPIQTPQYHSCSNGLVERMVQTLKRVLKIYTPNKGDIHTFLQKVLLTYRNSRITSSRGFSPASLFLDRQLRHPLISFNSKTFVYTPKTGQRHQKCELLVQNSLRTVYVQCDEGVVRLAHIDQLKPLN